MEGVAVFFVLAAPLALIGALVLVPQWLQAKDRRALYATIQSMAEKGQALSPEVVTALMQSHQPTRERDLRRGGVLLAFWMGLTLVGVAIAGALVASNVQEAWSAVLITFGLGAIPGAFGIAYLVFGLTRPKTA